MALLKLEKAKWHTYFDRVSKHLIGKHAEIDVDSLALGAQVEAKWLPLLGIVYDPKNDIIEIALDDLDHMVRKPREVYVDEGSTGLISLEVLDGDGVQHIVQFRDPLMLPLPTVSEQKGSLATKQD
ncbi:MAG: DUF5335 domain-containing protein [Burkholderiales bacterium]